MGDSVHSFKEGSLTASSDVVQTYGLIKNTDLEFHLLLKLRLQFALFSNISTSSHPIYNYL